MTDTVGNVHQLRPNMGTSDKLGRGGHNGGNDEPPGGGNMEARVAVLEESTKRFDRDFSEIKATVSEIRREGFAHFKWTITIILTLAGFAGGILFSMKGDIADLKGDSRSMQVKLDTQQAAISKMEATLQKSVDQGVQADRKVDRLEMRMDAMESTLQEIKKAVTK